MIAMLSKTLVGRTAVAGLLLVLGLAAGGCTGYSNDTYARGPYHSGYYRRPYAYNGGHHYYGHRSYHPAYHARVYHAPPRPYDSHDRHYASTCD
jgi:hypothetical protein